MALIIEKGFGQVEPNHLSGQKTGEIYAMLPADASIENVQNGMFMKYDYANGVMTFDAAAPGPYHLVFSEVKLYDEKESYKDFVLTKENSSVGKIHPRLMATKPTDHFTTNMVDMTTAKGARKGKLLQIVNGILTETDSPVEGEQVWQVVKDYTLADGQQAVKVMRVA